MGFFKKHLDPRHSMKKVAEPMGLGGSSKDAIAGGKFDVADIWGQQGARDAAEAEAEAAAAQETQADKALAEYRRQFDISQENLAPWLEAGGGALSAQKDFLGLSGKEAQQAAYDNYQMSPGQEFLRKRGEKALVRQHAAIGGLGGGRVRSALNQQGIGFAAQDFGNHYNRLAGLSNTGQQTGQQLGSLGQNFASNSAQQYGMIGNARASGIYGGQQARAQGDSQFRETAGTIASYFSDKRLKNKIKKICDFKGFEIHSWVWNKLHPDKTQHGKKGFGVIAQEIEKLIPKSVSVHSSGYKVVDYSNLGVIHG